MYPTLRLSLKNILFFILLMISFLTTSCVNKEGQKFVEAAFWGDYGTVRRALMDGMNVNARDEYGSTALIAAAEQNELRIVNLLLRNGANVNAKNQMGQTALLVAAFIPIRPKDQIEIIQRLIAAGAKVNAQDDKGDTPLMNNLLIQHPDIQVIKILIAKGANVNAQNRFGTTALMLAQDYGDPAILKLLHDAGAKE